MHLFFLSKNCNKYQSENIQQPHPTYPLFRKGFFIFEIAKTNVFSKFKKITKKGFYYYYYLQMFYIIYKLVF